MRNTTLTLFAIALLVILASPLIADGGIYIGDFQVSSDDAVVFSDNFSKGDLAKWKKAANPDESIAINNGGGTENPSYIFHLNRHRQPSLCVRPSVGVSNPGNFQITAKVLLPPASEQYDYQHGIFSSVMLQVYSKTTKARFMYVISTVISTTEKTNGYLVGLSSDETSNTQRETTTSSPVISPNKWVTIKLRMDSKASTLYAYLDERQLLTLPYKPDDFGGIGTIQIVSEFGDGILITESEDR